MHYTMHIVYRHLTSQCIPHILLRACYIVSILSTNPNYVFCRMKYMFIVLLLVTILKFEGKSKALENSQFRKFGCIIEISLEPLQKTTTELVTKMSGYELSGELEPNIKFRLCVLHKTFSPIPNSEPNLKPNPNSINRARVLLHPSRMSKAVILILDYGHRVNHRASRRSGELIPSYAKYNNRGVPSVNNY